MDIQDDATTETFIVGYHGTDAHDEDGILRDNFRESIGRDHWLENGVYFFVEGVSDSPKDDAEKWAIAQAWNNAERRYRYTKYIVLEAKIKYENVWDLTTQEGLKMFNYARAQIINKISLEYTLDRDSRQDYYDADVIEEVRSRLNFQIVKANVYIRFRFERIRRIYSHIPNVTIMSVLHPQQNIEKDSIHVVKRGEIRR